MLLHDFTSKAIDVLGLKKGHNLNEKGKWIGEFSLAKYDFTRADGSIDTVFQQAYEVDAKSGKFSSAALKDKYGEFFVSDEVIGRNLLTNYGINSIIWPGVAGGTYTAMSNANARIGVGDSTTAAVATQTDLQAASNKTYVAMNASFPTYGTSQQLVLQSTFTGAQANYAWQEFISDNGTAGHAMNRLVSSQGTKTSGQSWQVTLTITLS